MLLLGNSEGAVRSGPAADWPVHPAECRREGRTLIDDDDDDDAVAR